MKPVPVELEYEKNPDLRKEDVLALKDWVEKQAHLPNLTDLELIIFLHSCYYSIEAAKVTIDTNYTLRTHCPEFFKNRNASDKPSKQALDIGCFTVIPGTTPEGYFVAGLTLLDTDPSKFSLVEFAKIFGMLTDLWLLEQGTAKGHIIYLDLLGVQLGHVSKLSIMPIKKILMFLQDALPIRLKGFHFVNAVPFMDKILMLMKPFMKKELLELLYIHENPETFYEHVPKKMLPKELGGEAGSYKSLEDKYREKLLANKDWFKEEELTRRVDESKREGKAKNAGDLFGVEGSFKKLSID